MVRGPEISITKEGFYFWELGQQHNNPNDDTNNKEHCHDELETSIREVNIVNVDNDSSTSGEEKPQDYKPAEYLLLHQK